ncbi:Reverse transcriptase RNA-dependent DNA polymerase [Arabidopsis thaliana x Arabidopsis arenosa]|uniref:Reverse transcriptase RNA-dependent DNA polymerase n=1 Tax=Arabidopsis thaliana x Arabidopsis arenosa TaxID=1240361 RepID=A0A8T1YD75_9BRAS|nr:Reverse transcriptase RNA-dependent DNA polymerase [Arabidopsis thaliana x Arabidopsis arenosa]
MVSVSRLRRRTRRSSKESAEKTPDRSKSSPILPISSPIPPISSPIQHNFTQQPSLHQSPKFDFMDSHYSPYALSHGDNPGSTIVSEVLDGSNFSSWKIAMFVALDAKNKFAFVDGSLPRPPEYDPSFRVWSRCNSMVKSWILNSVTKQIYKSILRFNDASEIWRDLITRFHITNLPRSYQLTQQIWSLQQGSMSLSDYYTALKTLWDDLDGATCTRTCQNCKCCKATGTIADHAKIVKFLSGLNESYAAIRSQIIMKKTIPDLAEIYNLLDQDHSQRNIVTVPNASAFQVSTNDQFTVNATRSSYQQNTKAVPNKIQCAHCGYTGHSVDTCYKIHGYPIGFKHKQKTDGKTLTSKPVVANLALNASPATNTKGIGPNEIAELVGNMSKSQLQYVIAYFSTQLHNPAQPITIASVDVASSCGSNGSAFTGITFSPSTQWFMCVMTASRRVLTSSTWIIDSGASHHVSYDKNLFESLSDGLSSAVTLPTGSNVNIAGIGVIKLNAQITLTNVLYIPEFRLNLLSVSQLTRASKSRVFFDEECYIIQDHTKEQTIGRGKEIGGLYVLDNSSAECTSLNNSPLVSPSPQVSVVVDSALWHSRLGHPSYDKIDNNMSPNSFDLVHIDTWGPFATPTVEGYIYFLTIVDDHSRATWVFLMKTKNEVLQIFPEFIQMVNTQFQTCVKAVRSDNAPELRFDKLYKEKGYKGYKLLDVETNTIHISRHVVFFENIFPFATKDGVPADIFNIESGSDDSVSVLDPVSNDVEIPVFTPATTPTTMPEITPATTSKKKSGKRKTKSPGYLQDYHCNAVPNVLKDVRYPISASINYAQLSEEFTAYICAINKYPEPRTYAQAKQIQEWIDAMEIEIDALEETNTWTVCSLPYGKKPIGCKWIFKVKLNSDGSLERFKARLVAKGYTQKEGVDYGDTFSPVAKMTTVKVLLSVSAAKNWNLHQLDISNAFLNGDLDEEIYMSLPQGYSPRKGGSLPDNAVLKLEKSLYGLKQASRQWYLKFSTTLMNLGFKKSQADHTLFTRKAGNVFTSLLVYVDDIVIAGNDEEVIAQLKVDLAKAFKLRDLGPLKYFLGLEIARSVEGISICQRKYTLELLEETGLLGCRPSSIPMEPSQKLTQHNDEPEIENPETYRRLVGKLMYLTITRPDITFAVNKLCQFSSSPKRSHLNAAYKVVHYLKGTAGLGLFYSSKSDLCLKAYTDADWGSCVDSRRSTSGYCMFLGDSLVSWKSKKQDMASASSAESEYRAMAMASKEIAWLVKLVAEFQIPHMKPVPMFCDSTAAIHIANNSVFHERTKHIENDCHITRDRIEQGLLKTLHVTTTSQLADILTKPLFPSLFNSLLSKMSLLSIYVSS